MTNMKLEKQEQKEEMACMPEPQEYPYGLRIRLDDKVLTKLGIESLPAVGGEMVLNARVKICGASSSDSIYGKHQEMELQITDMELATKGD